MSVWEKHAEKLRRQREIARRQDQLARFDRWCLAHPWRARFMALGLAILIAELGMLLRYGIEFLAR